MKLCGRHKEYKKKKNMYVVTRTKMKLKKNENVDRKCIKSDSICRKKKKAKRSTRKGRRNNSQKKKSFIFVRKRTKTFRVQMPAALGIHFLSFFFFYFFRSSHLVLHVYTLKTINGRIRCLCRGNDWWWRKWNQEDWLVWVWMMIFVQPHYISFNFSLSSAEK